MERNKKEREQEAMDTALEALLSRLAKRRPEQTARSPQRTVCPRCGRYSAI